MSLSKWATQFYLLNLLIWATRWEKGTYHMGKQPEPSQFARMICGLKISLRLNMTEWARLLCAVMPEPLLFTHDKCLFAERSGWVSIIFSIRIQYHTKLLKFNISFDIFSHIKLTFHSLIWQWWMITIIRLWCMIVTSICKWIPPLLTSVMSHSLHLPHNYRSFIKYSYRFHVQPYWSILDNQ